MSGRKRCLQPRPPQHRKQKTLKAKPTGRAEGETAASRCSLLVPMGNGGRGPTGSSRRSPARSLWAAGIYVQPHILPPLRVWLLAAKAVKPPSLGWFQFITCHVQRSPCLLALSIDVRFPENITL